MDGSWSWGPSHRATFPPRLAKPGFRHVRPRNGITHANYAPVSPVAPGNARITLAAFAVFLVRLSSSRSACAGHL